MEDIYVKLKKELEEKK